MRLYTCTVCSFLYVPVSSRIIYRFNLDLVNIFFSVNKQVKSLLAKGIVKYLGAFSCTHFPQAFDLGDEKDKCSKVGHKAFLANIVLVITIRDK